jgi:hypothetical protein
MSEEKWINKKAEEEQCAMVNAGKLHSWWVRLPLRENVRVVAVTSYIPRDMKERMDRVVALDRHMTISRLIDEAVERYLPELESRSFPKPTQEPHENN